ncbi:hypothetical protein VW29_07675 [Devosia limi DSM 17137]|uniref:DUF2214 domain-containing protein n=1 Tax=Devosia limi DSM 17137 TaxID=1121477 RepID=A0A0F5LSS8_9HYPH|nr:hypothetical protein [Devosia limi]KKB85194.1 hypothetical protein VW29_07675 [Devosia limi DSM 17137]SHF75605.1 hypothetical protein SAMN02745223_03459 [Devosia limi DSM 17137]
MIGLLEALEASAPASFLRGSFIVYPLVNALHILAIGALLTCALLMDLAILGIGRRLPAAAAVRYLRPVAILALLVAVLSGALLFSVQPLDYVGNPAFRLKLLLLAVALLNAGVFVLLQGRLSPNRAPMRVLALASLLLWPSVLVAGRFIGFLG